MDSMINTSAFDRATQPIFSMLSPEQVHQIVDYHAEEALQDRIAELADKANEGELTEDDQAEYEGYVHANRFVAILQAQARRRIASPSRWTAKRVSLFGNERAIGVSIADCRSSNRL